MGIIIYMLLGYWSAGRTVYKNQILIGTTTNIYLRKLVTGFVFGWILIPVAVISLFIGRR